MRIFTKRFFNLSLVDQIQVVNAALADLEGCVGRAADKPGRERARRMVRRIVQKAVEYRVYSSGTGPGRERLKQQQRQDKWFRGTVEELTTGLSRFDADAPVDLVPLDADIGDVRKIAPIEGNSEMPTAGEVLHCLHGLPRTMIVILCQGGIMEVNPGNDKSAAGDAVAPNHPVTSSNA